MCISSCNDDRWKVIGAAKKDLFKCTNILDNPDEMKFLDSFLFRCWQMGWLNQYKEPGDKYEDK